MKSIKFVFAKAIAILFFILSASKSFSQSSSENYIKTDAANKVQFVGIEGEYLIFDLRFSEMSPKGCTLSIIDESSNLFFEELISGSSYTRRYKIVREGVSRIVFKAVGRGFLFNQSFTIKKEEKLVVIAD